MSTIDIFQVYADGGVIGTNPSLIGGTWAFCFVNSDGKRWYEASGIIWPTEEMPLVTNNVAELTALVEALETVPERWAGMVESDSLNALGRVFQSWALNGVPPSLAHRLGAAQRRVNLRSSLMVLLSGHPTKAELAAGISKKGRPVSEHNVWCDWACTQHAIGVLTRMQKGNYFDGDDDSAGAADIHHGVAAAGAAAGGAAPGV